MTLGFERQLLAQFPIGTDIEVRDRFCASWRRGFAVVDSTYDGYQVRRVSDGYVLPVRFLADEVRRAT